MANYDIVSVARQDLFTAQDELNDKYPGRVVEHVLRLRDMYNWYLAHPEESSRRFVEVVKDRYGIAKTAAYEDLNIIKVMLPGLTGDKRDFHRWRYNEMILETYRMAKARKDTKTMERAASSYAKYNKIDADDGGEIPFDMIVVQPFTATNDPSVLGIKPIPNLKEKIQKMLAKYREETLDIEDVDFEEADLEEDELFPAETDKS